MSVLEWFGTSPIASFLRVFAAGILGWVILNADSLNIHPALVIGLVSALPVLIAWLNPSDPRFGNVETDQDGTD
jgi:TctA family transporter